MCTSKPSSHNTAKTAAIVIIIVSLQFIAQLSYQTSSTAVSYLTLRITVDQL